MHEASVSLEGSVQAKVAFVFSLQASSSIWASEASRARTRERVYFSRYPPDGELARRLSFLDVIWIDISTRWRFMKRSDTKSKQTQNFFNICLKTVHVCMTG